MTQNQALEILKTGGNVFVTGPAGSGKTHLINKYIAYLREHDIDAGITASTGIAATHMGGMTIHSWAGIGIKDEDKQRIFDRFYQVQHGDAHDFGGSGIGLHMVKEFVNLHGGQIQITDNVGGGSVFTFTIPVVNPQESFDWMEKGAMTEEVIID